MKVSLNWLAEFVDLPTRDPEELRHALAMLGHEVEGVETIEAGWSGVSIARVEGIEAHPNADKVRVCAVTVGDQPIQVVCGAWNFEAGDIVAFAVPGAVLPGGFEIGVRTIRGVESNGMICSESELGLGEDRDGIMVLPANSPLGAPLEDLLDMPDVVFDLSITPNRPDAMSMVGIARDLGAWYETAVSVPPPRLEESDGSMGFEVDILDPVGNPRFAARRVDDVAVGAAPLWMRRRLTRAGVRPISNLVDVTNYVMLELGQPLHVFDAERIAGSRLVVRRAKAGETLITLDGVERTLTEDDLVIADSEGPTSLAGTMGGERSEVGASTVTTIIEAASWDPPTVMFMSRRHGLRSEASARFERGVDPQLPPVAVTRAAELILATAGGKACGEWIDQVAVPFEETQLRLATEDVTRLLGNDFDQPRIASLLTRLGFDVAGDDPMAIGVPSYRPDVTRPIDLVEEVARLADYDTFGERVRRGRNGGVTAAELLRRRLRQFLTANGYSQAVTLSFVTPAEVEAFGAPPEHEWNQLITVKNPLSDEEAMLRPSLLPGLLRAVRHNRNRGRADISLFEQARVFHASPWVEDRRVPSQPERLAVVAAGGAGPFELSGGARPVDIYTIAGLVRAMASRFSLDVRLQQAQAPGFHPTRTAVAVSGEHTIGTVGELHPRVATAYGIEGRVVAAELDLRGLISAADRPEYRPVSPYPPVDFDLSFELPADVAAANLVATLQSTQSELTEAVQVFDEFTGPGLGEGRKSLAVRVRLRAPDRTLATGEIATVRRQMIEAAQVVGAMLRGES